ncbi:MAG: DMT family transporter [Actinomycetota bacterium]|nr:DMT family transporter [Actinomycetota bacterium]
MPAHPSIHRVLMLVAAAACWGVGTVITKQVLGDVAPLTLLPLQLAASCVFLLLVSLVGRTRVAWSPQLRRLTALGVLNPGLAYLLGLLGLASITASMSVLLWATEPVLILLLAVLLLRDRVAGGLVVAMVVAVLGVLLVVYQPSASGSGGGVALTLAGVLACALYTVLARRLLLDDASVSVALVQQAAALGFALVVLAGAQAVTGDELDLGSMGLADWLGATASGVLYYGLAFWFYLAGLRQVSAAVAGSFITLVPVFGVAGGYVVGERLTAWQWVGAAVVVAAVAVVAVRQRNGRDVAVAP